MASAPRQRVTWVTGGSRGIGAATCRRLAQAGHDIAIGAHRSLDEAQSVAQDVAAAGRRAFVAAADMQQYGEVRAAHEAITEGLGPVDTLVVSHGIYERRSLDDTTDDDFGRILDVNLTGAFRATRLVVPQMRAQGFGRIVYLGSILGRTGSPQGADYAASKAGLLALARSIAQQVAADGITVNLVAPSMIDTDILAGDSATKRAERERSVPVGRIGSAEECAEAIEHLVSETAGYVTGTEYRLDGGFKMG